MRRDWRLGYGRWSPFRFLSLLDALTRAVGGELGRVGRIGPLDREERQAEVSDALEEAMERRLIGDGTADDGRPVALDG